MSHGLKREKVVVVGAGPVGALAALYAAQRGHDVEIYELRNGTFSFSVDDWIYGRRQFTSLKLCEV
jgi:2-polyprenyl-6-methoxyphenol hydroxylase-like FAD-dependent oxidoreductase